MRQDDFSRVSKFFLKGLKELPQQKAIPASFAAKNVVRTDLLTVFANRFMADITMSICVTAGMIDANF